MWDYCKACQNKWENIFQCAIICQDLVANGLFVVTARSEMQLLFMNYMESFVAFSN